MAASKLAMTKLAAAQLAVSHQAAAQLTGSKHKNGSYDRQRHNWQKWYNWQ
jgi:hypothetical protein